MRSGVGGRLLSAGILVGVTLGLIAPAVVARAETPASQWQPEAASYGVGQTLNQSVTAADGTVLKADVYYPTDPVTGQASSGPFPVLLVQTPYGKTGGHSAGSFAPSLSVGDVPYLIQRGYIDVVADVRGTGDSGGVWGLFDPVQQSDSATLVNWAAQLPHSSGKVGLYGPSYMGIDQFLTVNALGPDSPVKAIFPVIPANDIYRDTVTMGGIPDAEFSLAYLALTGAINEANPFFENYNDPVGSLQTALTHSTGLASTQLQLAMQVETGGDPAYDQAYWQARNPRNVLAKVVANNVPAFIVGGWFDLFQRGEPLDYSGLQNVFAGTDVGAPMQSGRPATGRYQLLMGPWYHLTAGNGVDMLRLQLAWFDRWLKDINTGIDQTSTPEHLFMLGRGSYVDASTYPLDQLTPTTFYLGQGPSSSGSLSTNDGRLTAAPPSAPAGADQAAYTGLPNPCGRQVEQWSMGAYALVASAASLPANRCDQDDRAQEVGPGALTYTTDPLIEDKVIGGPIDATMFMTSTRPDAELVATVEDVSPDGTSMPLTTGAQAASFRALDQGQTWFAPDGKPILPYHPFTQASMAAVQPGEVARVDIEVFPTLAQIAKGHRIRLTLNTSDSPHLAPTLLPQLPNMLLGVYQVQRTASAASFLEVPMGRPSDFQATTLQGLPGVKATAVNTANVNLSNPLPNGLPNTSTGVDFSFAAGGILAAASLAGFRLRRRIRRRG